MGLNIMINEKIFMYKSKENDLIPSKMEMTQQFTRS